MCCVLILCCGNKWCVKISKTEDFRKFPTNDDHDGYLNSSQNRLAHLLTKVISQTFLIHFGYWQSSRPDKRVPLYPRSPRLLPLPNAARCRVWEVVVVVPGWWYHSLTAHQHQKGHTVPKQVIMIATSIQVASLSTVLCESNSLSGQV